MATVTIAGREIGPDHPPYLVAEIGINHNGDIDAALEMIGLAKMAGADAVKFQKRTPRLSVPEHMWDDTRLTPWGYMPYIEYKERLEFGVEEYNAIASLCACLEIPWFASVWDEESLEFMEQFNPPCYKIGSASLNNRELVQLIVNTGKPTVLSTGMSTIQEISQAIWGSAIQSLHEGRLIVCHSTSIYPCPKEKLNLRRIAILANSKVYVTGYSGHEISSRITPAAVALGASYIERHFTLDRRGWGTDQSCSLEYDQFKDMAERCHEIWSSLGTGIKEVYPEELEKKKQLVV